jgi:hypothetical protein
MVFRMGKRKLGILTDWQRSYINGQESEELDRKRRAVENHYLRETYDNLDVVFEDLNLLCFWAKKMDLDTRVIKSVKGQGEALRKIYSAPRGRPMPKYSDFWVELQCPKCNTHYSQLFAVQDGNFVLGKTSLSTKNARSQKKRAFQVKIFGLVKEEEK